jgi:DNA-binding response OmpR family regulator
MKILIVEDSSRLRRSIRMGLEKEGFTIDETGDGEEGLWFIESFVYNVVILDIMLPGLDGLTIVEKVRKNKNNTSILILSALDTVDDRVKGLKLGADDYLVKPFSYEELLARIYALIRRSNLITSNMLSSKGVELNVDNKTVTYNGNVVTLPPREYLILEILMLKKGKVVSRSEIEEYIYHDDKGQISNVVDSAVCVLRKHFNKDLIKTRRGQGFIIE